MHQTHFLGVAHTGAAGLGVLNDVQRLVQIGSVVHVHMADAGAGLDAGDFGVLHTGADEPGTAAGDQQVHIAHSGHQGVGRSVGGVLDQAHRRFGQTGLAQALPQSGDDGVGTAPGFLAAA